MLGDDRIAVPCAVRLVDAARRNPIVAGDFAAVVYSVLRHSFHWPGTGDVELRSEACGCCSGNDVSESESHRRDRLRLALARGIHFDRANHRGSHDYQRARDHATKSQLISRLSVCRVSSLGPRG